MAFSVLLVLATAVVAETPPHWVLTPDPETPSYCLPLDPHREELSRRLLDYEIRSGWEQATLLEVRGQERVEGDRGLSEHIEVVETHRIDDPEQVPWEVLSEAVYSEGAQRVLCQQVRFHQAVAGQ